MSQWAPPVEQQPPQPIPPRRRHRKWPWIVVGGLVAAVAAATTAGGGGSLPAPSTPSAASLPPYERTLPVPPNDTSPPTVHTGAPMTDSVIYTITSDAPAISVTYTTEGVNQEQANEVAPPFKQTVSFLHQEFGFYSVVAQMDPATNGGPEGTTISCSIMVNGTVVSEHTSTGSYAVVTCSGDNQ